MLIKQYREKSGLTQSEAAKRMAIDQSFWCRIENGEVDLPPYHYKRASELFDIPMTKLINARIVTFAKELCDEVNFTKPFRCDIKIA